MQDVVFLKGSLYSLTKNLDVMVFEFSFGPQMTCKDSCTTTVAFQRLYIQNMLLLGEVLSLALEAEGLPAVGFRPNYMYL